MSILNVAECHVEAGVSQQADITVLTKKIDDSQFLDTSFLDLPFEVQCHFFRQISAAEIRELKAVSKDLKRLIEKNWRPAFYILPPKVQIKILTETQMTSSEIRCMKLVSKDMKYLIERGGRHLTKQELRTCRIEEIAPGSCKVTLTNNHRRQHISLEHFSQILAHSHISRVFINRVNLTLDFCDEMQHLRKNKIICRTLILGACNFNDEEILTVIDRLLGATEASGLCVLGYANEMKNFNKEFFWMPSVRKLRELCIHGLCHFSDDNLSAGNYRWLRLINCCLSEHALRRIIEEVMECKRDIECYTFKVQKSIDVDRLLIALPNIQKITEGLWTLQTIKDQVMELSIANDLFIFKMNAN